MPTLRNTATGAVVSCSEETAARLGSQWEPLGEKPAEKKATPSRGRKAKAKTDSSDED